MITRIKEENRYKGKRKSIFGCFKITSIQLKVRGIKNISQFMIYLDDKCVLE